MPPATAPPTTSPHRPGDRRSAHQTQRPHDAGRSFEGAQASLTVGRARAAAEEGSQGRREAGIANCDIPGGEQKLTPTPLQDGHRITDHADAGNGGSEPNLVQLHRLHHGDRQDDASEAPRHGRQRQPPANRGHDLGYSSVQHLSSQFRSVTGMSVTQYKQLEIKPRRALNEVK